MPRNRRRSSRIDKSVSAKNSLPLTSPGIPGSTYKPLQPKDINLIIGASYEILERTGVQVLEGNCLEIFRSAGCRVDEENNRVHIHASLIDHTLEIVKSEILLAGLDHQHDLHLGGAGVYLGTGVFPP